MYGVKIFFKRAKVRKCRPELVTLRPTAHRVCVS